MLTPSDDHQRRRVSVADAEADYYEGLRELLTSAEEQQDQQKAKRRAETLAKPFGFQHEAWEGLKAQMQPGDELWEFCSPRSDWNAFMGVAGYELVRDGVVMATVVTRRN